MAKGPRKSQKQRAHEHAEARAAKIPELEGDFEEYKRLCAEIGWPFPGDKESFIARKLAEWENEQVIVPTGRYQDDEKICAEYQMHFIKYVQECCPEVLDELRDSVPDFRTLFGEDRDKFHVLFDPYKTMFLFDLLSSLESLVNHRIRVFPKLAFRSPITARQTFRQDFRWGESYGPLLVLRLLLIEDTAQEEAHLVFSRAVDEIRRHLVLNVDTSLLPESFDDAACKVFLRGQATAMIADLVKEGADTHLKSLGWRRISDFVNEFSSDEAISVEALLRLTTGLVEWATAHHLEKDWLLRYACHFLTKFDENPDITVQEVVVTPLSSYSLESLPFEFNFNAWFPGFEAREAYEKRLRIQFEDDLARHFSMTARDLDLDGQKKETRPRKYERVKWLVRAAIQGWTIDQILDDIAGDGDGIPESEPDESTIRKAIKELSKYNLPTPR